MTDEEVQQLAEEFVENIPDPNKELIIRFAKDCNNSGDTMPTSLGQIERILHIYDTNDKRQRFNSFIKSINPRLDIHAIWENPGRMG